MSRCLICNCVKEETFNTLFNNECKLCYDCLKKFKVRNIKFFIDGVEGVVLYYYDEFFKDVLYRYKGCGDYALKDTFGISELKNKYKGYAIVLAPSNKEDESKRGFNHLEGIFKNLKKTVVKCFEKTENWKQSSKKIMERSKVQNIIKIDKSCLNGIKKVLIVDDVLTTGSTIKTLIRQIPANIHKKVLVLSSNCRIKANEIV